MKRNSLLAHQTVKRDRKKKLLVFKRTLGQLGFGLIKMFLFLLCLGALSMGLISGYRFLSSASWLSVQDIVVIGAREPMKSAVIILSEVTEKDSLLSIDTASVERKIEKHPWIKAVSVTRSFPHMLRIEVTHEEPIAVAVLDRMWLINREGVPFKTVAKHDPIDFPIITGICVGDQAVGEHLKRVAGFLTTYSLSRMALAARELSEVHVEKDGALNVYFNELPCKVFFGRDDFARKIDSLQRIIKHLDFNHQLDHAKSIDIDYQNRAVVAFKDRVV
jgi:cell division septal protein FtsQ